MSSSFNIVNYSLRPNKTIQRSLVFEGIRVLLDRLALLDPVYIGFGSVWFTDFLTAHRELEIRDMISIESNDIGFARAAFNTPFKTVRLEHGLSTEVLPKLLTEKSINSRPWIVWLDYDGGLSEVVTKDIQTVIEEGPPNSIILVTFNGSGNWKYGAPKDREKRIRALLGDVVPDDVPKEKWDDESLPTTLASLTVAYMQSVAVAAGRPGGFVPAFKLTYRDTANMTTAGGALPTRGGRSTAAAEIRKSTWAAIVDDPIITPMLTIKEAQALQAALPRGRALTRRTVQRLGFDLEEEQVRAFETYYRFYPTYAQIVT